MSTYLTIYIQPKGGKPINLISYTSSSEVYQYFRENIDIVYLNDNSDKYTELTSEKINNILHDVESDLHKIKARLEIYGQHAHGNIDVLNEIVELQESYDTLLYVKHIVLFIDELIHEGFYLETGKNKILCNIG